LGMTCKSITFLADESPEEFYAEVERAGSELNCVSQEEWAEAEIVVFERWKLRRTRNAEGSAANQKIEHIKNNIDDRNADQARSLLADLSVDPNRIMTELRKSTTGCSLLLQQWTLIRDWLLKHKSFEVSLRSMLLELSGRRSSDLFTNP